MTRNAQRAAYLVALHDAASRNAVGAASS